MSSVIRSLVEADLDAVVSIADQFPHNSWSKRVFADCLKAGYEGWVVVDVQDRIQGFLVVSLNHKECQIMNIGVQPTEQRQGLGGMLLHHLFNFLRSKHHVHFRVKIH